MHLTAMHASPRARLMTYGTVLHALACDIAVPQKELTLNHLYTCASQPCLLLPF